VSLLRNRIECRDGHFMPVTLLKSQLDLLEPLTPDEWGSPWISRTRLRRSWPLYTPWCNHQPGAGRFLSDVVISGRWVTGGG
jgi:hypothetical protein